MARRMLEIVLVAAFVTAVAAPAWAADKTPPPKKTDKNQDKSEDLQNVKFVKFAMQGQTGVVSAVEQSGKNIMVKIAPLVGDNKKMEPNQELINVVKDLKPGDLLTLSVITKADGSGRYLDSATKQDGPIVDESKLPTFESSAEGMTATGQPQVTVVIKLGDKNDTYTVPNVKDSAGKVGPDADILAEVKALTKGDKVDFKCQPSSKILKSIKLVGAPDKAEFIKVADMVTIGAEKFMAIQIREGKDAKEKPVTLLVPNVKDDSGKPVPDAKISDEVKALTPGQMVLVKAKAENPGKIMLAEISPADKDAASKPADKADDKPDKSDKK